MKLNRKWLNEEFVDLSGVPDREFVETMTIAGQKVETYERLDAELRNVVVGRVVSITRHTNSDHMWVCQIDVGAGEPVQIVTGAQNVHEGDLVPVAQPREILLKNPIPGCPAACTSQRASCAARYRTACSAP